MSLATVVACRQLVGIPSEPPFEDATDAGGTDAAPACGLALPPDGACRACAESRCCSALEDCAGSVACNAYQTCSLACGADVVCRTKCLEDHPLQLGPETPALDACLATACEKECELGCGGAMKLFASTAAPTCIPCIEAVACSANERCSRDPGCLALQYCLQSCVTPDCAQACHRENDAGAGQELNVVAVGISGHCLRQCAVGNDWRCVDRVTWPFPKTPTVAVVQNILHYGDARPFAGVDVKLCTDPNPSCVPDVAHVTTGPDGVASFTVPAGFLGFFELGGPNVFPELYYPGFPFTSDWTNPNLGALDDQAMANFASQAGVTLDPARGHLAVFAYDCATSNASGVTFAITGTDAKSTFGYYSSGVPTPDAHETDGSGAAGIWNVVPGLVTITATPKALGRPSSRVTVAVRAGTLTVAQVQPQAQ